MSKAFVRMHFWDQPQLYDGGRFDLKTGDRVIIKADSGLELGEVTQLAVETDKKDGDDQPEPVNSVVRKVTTEDLAKLEQHNEQKEEVLDKCRHLIKKHNLPMNLVDCEFSFDGGRIVFTFTADSRVDFRNLVKDLSHIFQKSIRLQQIGIRDETKRLGDIGVCGRPMCCRKFLDNLGNVSSDLARAQQVAHRGSERISGSCGRLMCCLAYEEELYKTCSKDLPQLGSIIKTKQGKGEVVAWNILKHSVDVRIEDNSYIEVEIPGSEQCLKLQSKKQ
ncbi:MAG: regulatory iron-sulfur-containing complex subunit RicT [Patescibacteria group bacterium]